MQNLKIGHATLTEQGTGISVFLFAEPAVGVYHLCGSAPASLELPTLDLDAAVSHFDGLVFVGGSAFGLGAVAGVMKFLKREGRGFPTRFGPVPIVPAVALYDLGIESTVAPTAADAEAACTAATANNPLRGRIGAGTGATVGKLVAGARSMSGGFGMAELSLANGVQVAAYAVVSSVGDVRTADGRIIAGARWPNGEFANGEAYLLQGHTETLTSVANTTLIAVFTNASFNKIELKRIAKVATAGMARAISPVFTRYDGDILFMVGLGSLTAPEHVVATMAAEAVRQAIVNAVQDSVII